jgi:hypothetical protein
VKDVLSFGTILITVVWFQFDAPLDWYLIPHTGYILTIQDAIGVVAIVILILYNISPILESLDSPLQRNE